MFSVASGIPEALRRAAEKSCSVYHSIGIKSRLFERKLKKEKVVSFWPI